MSGEKVERLRQKAEDCVQNASRVSKPETKVMWLEMAQQYLQLADSFEKVTAHPAPTEPAEKAQAQAVDGANFTLGS